MKLASLLDRNRIVFDQVLLVDTKKEIKRRKGEKEKRGNKGKKREKEKRTGGKTTSGKEHVQVAFGYLYRGKKNLTPCIK